MSSTKNVHSSVDSAEDMLRELGLQNIRPCGDEIQFSCPYPGHKNNDAHPSAFFNLNKNVFHCFSCGANGSLESLYKFITGQEINAFSIAELKFNQVNNSAHKITDILKAQEVATNIYQDSILDKYKEIPQDMYSYLIKRVKNPDIISLFELGYDKETQKATMPIRNARHQLVGIIGHMPYSKGFKYLPILPEKGFKKTLFLYGMDKVDRKIDTAILVEGMFDVVAGYSLGYKNVLGLQGAFLAEEQEAFLRMNFNKIVLALDNDKAGAHTTKHLIKHLKYKFEKIEVFKYPPNIKDLGDMIN